MRREYLKVMKGQKDSRFTQVGDGKMYLSEEVDGYIGILSSAYSEVIEELEIIKEQSLKDKESFKQENVGKIDKALEEEREDKGNLQKELEIEKEQKVLMQNQLEEARRNNDKLQQEKIVLEKLIKVIISETLGIT